MGGWGRWRLDHVRRSHGVMSRHSSHDRLDEFDVLLDEMSDMEGFTVAPGDLDAELAALSDGSRIDVPIPLMDVAVTDTLLCADPDTIRRMSQPVLHPGQGHYARNCKTGAAAALPPVKIAVAAALPPVKIAVAVKGVADSADSVHASVIPGGLKKKPKNGKPKSSPHKKVPSNTADTLKKFQSREFKKAHTLATEKGLSVLEVKFARQLAYKNATEVWKARHAT